MIEQVDRLLARLLRDRVPLTGEEITFDPPNDGYRARHTAGQTVNLFLYDLRENHDLRSNDWTLEPKGDGTFTRTPPKARVDLLYVVTAWDAQVAEPDVLAEHALLSRVLRTLLAYPTLPESVLPGPPLGQGFPLPTLAVQPETVRNPAELWGALRQTPRPAIFLVVTLPVPPALDPDGPPALIQVSSRQLGMALAGGLGYRLVVRPPLARAFGPRARVRRVTVDSAPIARLQNAVFAAHDLIRVTRAQGLNSNDWVLVDDGAASELVLVGEVGGVGTRDVPLVFPLRSGHPAATPLRRAVAPDNDRIVTRLAAPSAADAATIELEGVATIVADAVLMISDGSRTELARAAAAPSATNELSLNIRPRFEHPAGARLYSRTLDALPANPADRTTLAEPAGQPGNQVVLDSGVVGAELDVMIGAGPRVELGRLATGPAGTALAIDPPLRYSHPAGTAVRRATPAEPIGEVLQSAPVGARLVHVIGVGPAVGAVRRSGRPLVAAGEVLALDEAAGAALFQVTEVEASQAVPGTAPELLFTINGRAVDSASQTDPVIGARISVLENGDAVPLLTTTSDLEGRFRFANLSPGTYQLRATATGYQDISQVVRVPSVGADEYQIALLR